jgi:hypothetical protein
MISYSASFRHCDNIGIIGSDGQGAHAVARPVTAVPLASKSRSEVCRGQAQECLEIGNRWSDLMKDEYVELARQWLMLAKQAEGAFRHVATPT